MMPLVAALLPIMRDLAALIEDRDRAVAAWREADALAQRLAEENAALRARLDAGVSVTLSIDGEQVVKAFNDAWTKADTLARLHELTGYHEADPRG